MVITILVYLLHVYTRPMTSSSGVSSPRCRCCELNTAQLSDVNTYAKLHSQLFHHTCRCINSRGCFESREAQNCVEIPIHVIFLPSCVLVSPCPITPPFPYLLFFPSWEAQADPHSLHHLLFILSPVALLSILFIRFPCSFLIHSQS